MRLQTIVYVTNMDASTDWYTKLLQTEPQMASSHWTSFAMGDATLALHHADTAQEVGNVTLSLVVDSLDGFIARFEPGATITEQPFGRSTVVVDPDGARIQVNEH